ncbi:C40 family peptidase [Mucilaginibacter myungsuensis]|uniref:C40 family peptidase n=1 Tax=Mucilaginibacter myungsuensis TaxID=649104 RepID=A0A929KVY5_9SPHI|nr:NlpC/P60 family protein [Mucilaginibacter myungsuensis]MBE9661438.1 C40 family peptidase [Mucilaginibacter myungsuensis]MDN3597581.1 NlpC/P60 family protein [Mucilaginibacter myungsuensis]
MKKLSLFIALFISVLAAQAQTKTVPVTAAPEKVEEQESLAKDYLSQVMGVALNATSNVKLFQAVYDWIGTPYRFARATKSGIDCSGFAKEIYGKVFNLDIKRNSRDIFSMVTPVAKDDLKEGDLVFFKIHSRSISHVGVYLGNGRFAHAASKGVAISNIDDSYYHRYFYKGGRMLEAFKSDAATMALTEDKQ